MNDNLNQRYRILLANTPRLLREIFKHAFQRYPDMEIVGETANSDDLYGQIKKSRADWILVSLHANGNFPDFVNSILDDYPGIGIIAISADGSQAKARCRENSRDDLANLSLNELMAIVRSELE